MEIINSNNALKTTRPRGFATLDADRRSEIARIGGRTAQSLGKAHKFTTEEARLAGKKRWQQDKNAPPGDNSNGYTLA